MKSLIQLLEKSAITLPIRIPSNFQTCPDSLKEIVRILNLSNPDLDTLIRKKVFVFSAENAQGVTFAYNNIWFLSNENKIFKYSITGNDLYDNPEVNRLDTRKLDELIESTNIDNPWIETMGFKTCIYNHIGDIVYWDGKNPEQGLLFLPVKNAIKGEQHLLLTLCSKTLHVVGYSVLPHGTGESCCAINPWNNLLYLPIVDEPYYFNAFDISEYYRIFLNPRRWGKSVNIIRRDDKRFYLYDQDGNPEQVSAQGIAFPNNGRLYVTRWEKNKGFFDNYLRIYNSLTGRRLADEKQYNFEGTGDEIEGISIHPSGVIYIAVADNDWPDTDEFEIHAFKYSDASFPV